MTWRNPRETPHWRSSGTRSNGTWCIDVWVRRTFRVSLFVIGLGTQSLKRRPPAVDYRRCWQVQGYARLYLIRTFCLAVLVKWHDLPETFIFDVSTF